MLEKMTRPGDRLSWSFDTRATSRAAGLMQKPLAIEFTSDTPSLELVDKDCLGLTLHIQDDMLRQLIIHASRLNTFSKVSKEVQDVAKGCRRCGAHAVRRQERARGKNKHKQCFIVKRKITSRAIAESASVSSTRRRTQASHSATGSRRRQSRTMRYSRVPK